MNGERYGQQPPENRVKSVELTEAVFRNKASGTEDADQTEKTSTRRKNHRCQQEIGDCGVKNQLVGEVNRFTGRWYADMYDSNHQMKYQDRPESDPVVGMKLKIYPVDPCADGIFISQKMKDAGHTTAGGDNGSTEN